MPLDQAAAIPAFTARAPYAPPDERAVAALLAQAPDDDPGALGLARRLAEAVRDAGGALDLEGILRGYPLTTREGAALMVLAEALLRVPDDATADRLIEDKLAGGDWTDAHGGWLLAAGGRALAAGAWLAATGERPGEGAGGVLAGLARRVGVPALRAAARRAVRVMGGQFVLGQTIEEALARARRGAPGTRHSFDMLGEGARTAADAGRYFDAYAGALEAIGRAAAGTLPDRPGLSVKLSALHPRYEAVSRERVLRELSPRLLELARGAKAHGLNLTVDAEEADRLELSLEVFAAVLADPSLSGWDGFGLAVQAYQKRAVAVCEWLDDLSAATGRRLMVRLVKGAYWDTEIKRAQERGLADYPVFTRKAATDLSYLVCARRLLAAPNLFPQFATHNALTLAAVLGMAGSEPFEFQRLHGMGEALYDALAAERPGTACRIYAPVGTHEDLLAYLVRRLLENGANTGFVAAAADPAVPLDRLLRRPQDVLRERPARHPAVPLPRDLYAPARRNSEGVELGDAASLRGLLAEIRAAAAPVPRLPDAGPEAAHRAVEAAHAAFPAWAATPVAERAAVLDRVADGLEARRAHLLHLLQAEGGKTLDDAVAELREAVDFARYYAAEARRLFGAPLDLPGPTGESNRLVWRGRGAWACVSPWNFPLAIFLGQVAAALVAGNTVVAKPAPQTPAVAAEAVALLAQAGLPPGVLHLVPGGRETGAALVAHPRVAGVAFTGSTAAAQAINRALAAKDGPIVPLVAETGGINAMVVDATALPEQVADDAVMSAFRSAGQRCSALRLLCVQEDVADKVIGMVAGAARELRVGDPFDPATHVGPLIDADARARIERHLAHLPPGARVLYAGSAPGEGHFVAPHVVELARASDLREEVFGPVLHVVRWRADGLPVLLDEVAGGGYGLTLGVHTRIGAVAELVAERVPAGNVYVNRNVVGAVVGTQPFGGMGLSGTGPKAGGPNYLTRFAVERVVTVNTAAAGGNAALVAGLED